MKLSEFSYELPEGLIAQTPIENREASRLLVLNRADGSVEHKHFYDLCDMVEERDCLILNDSKVIPARLYGNKVKTGGAVEFVLLKNIAGDDWEVMTRPGRIAKPGTGFAFFGGNQGPYPLLYGEIISRTDGGNRIVRFHYNKDNINFMQILDKIGNMPLPPYIKQKLEDNSRYQTVYAREEGSAAAPTAGLHFTKDMLERLKCGIGYVTLHVGLGTFRPVKTENIEEHLMHSEFYSMPEKTAELINKTKLGGGRVITVGTTSCRTLEAIAGKHGEIKACEGTTDIFIYPGYKFKAADALITNFHLPESTLLMLVSAFASRDMTLNAYKQAIDNEYRFFSFGDAMFIL